MVKMSETKKVTGAVYNIGNMPAREYFETIGEVAARFFPLRREAPLTRRHRAIIETVNGRVAEDM